MWEGEIGGEGEWGIIFTTAREYFESENSEIEIQMASENNSKENQGGNRIRGI